MKNIQVYAILLFVMLWWGLNVTMLKVLTGTFRSVNYAKCTNYISGDDDIYFVIFI